MKEIEQKVQNLETTLKFKDVKVFGHLISPNSNDEFNVVVFTEDKKIVAEVLENSGYKRYLILLPEELQAWRLDQMSLNPMFPKETTLIIQILL